MLSPSEGGLAEARRLQDLINDLTERRVALLRKVNAEQSTTKNIPNELLATIFRHACQGYDFLDVVDAKKINGRRYVLYDTSVSPLLLGAVSFQWKNVVESTPHLWTSLRVVVNNGNVRKIVSLLRRYLVNSKMLGCTVDLDIEEQTKHNSPIRNLAIDDESDDGYDRTESWSNNRELPLEPVREIIFNELPEQVYALRLVSPPPEWFPDYPDRPLSERFNKLKALHISWENVPFVEGGSPVGVMQPVFDIDVANVPGLQRVWLHNVSDSWKPFRNIVEFHLSLIDYNSCVALLMSCPSLRFCYMTRPRTEFDQGFADLGFDTCDVPLLETLEWTFPLQCPSDYEPYELLPALSIPSIQSLTLHNIFDTHCMPTEGLEEFLDNIPQSCQFLHISTDAHFDIEASPIMMECIEHIPSTIAYTSFRSLCAGFTDFIYMDDATPPLMLQKDFSMFSISPDYNQSVTIQDLLQTCSNWNQECDQPEFEPSEFLETMRLKFRGGSRRKFTFGYDTVYCKVEWDPDVQKSLKKLVADGLDLEILVDAQPVDWL